MSFTALKVAELKNVADEFGVDINGIANKSAIINELEENGVTYELYNNIKSLEDNKATSDDVRSVHGATLSSKRVFNEKRRPIDSDTMLIKMERSNLVYELFGVRFTKDHPYALVDMDTAQQIFEVVEGFRPATPKELQDYYG